MMKQLWNGMLAVLLVGLAGCVSGVSHNETDILQQRVDSLVALQPMDIGMAVSYRGELICAVNVDSRFPMMSVFKLHQAVALVDTLAHGPVSLDTEILVTPEMLHKDTYSPLRDAHPEGNVRLSIEQIMRYSLLQSDNNACDILFSLFGGTRYVQARMEELNLHDTQIKWTEDEMHRDTARTRDNYTTPREAVGLLEVAYRHPWLRPCMQDCRTGQGRIPALLPKDETRVGHKTGTGDALPDGRLVGINDIGFVALPDGDHYFIAVLCNHSALTMQETEAVIAELSRMAYEYVIERNK